MSRLIQYMRFSQCKTSKIFTSIGYVSNWIYVFSLFFLFQPFACFFLLLNEFYPLWSYISVFKGPFTSFCDMLLFIPIYLIFGCFLLLYGIWLLFTIYIGTFFNIFLPSMIIYPTIRKYNPGCSCSVFYGSPFSRKLYPSI